jgi:hypothetical protein
LQKEFAILFSLYQKEHFTPDALCKLKEDIVATTQRYPFIQHARILEDFYKKLGKCP